MPATVAQRQSQYLARCGFGLDLHKDRKFLFLPGTEFPYSFNSKYTWVKSIRSAYIDGDVKSEGSIGAFR